MADPAVRYSVGIDRSRGPDFTAAVILKKDADGKVTVLASLAGEAAEALAPYVEAYEWMSSKVARVSKAIDALAERNPDRLYHEPGVLLVTPCKPSDPANLLECEIEFGGVTLAVSQLEVKFGDDWRRVWVFPRSAEDLARYKVDLEKGGRLKAAPEVPRG